MTKCSRQCISTTALNMRFPSHWASPGLLSAPPRQPTENDPSPTSRWGEVEEMERRHRRCAMEEALQLPGGLASSPIPSATEYGGFWDRPLCMAHIRGLCRPVGALPASPMGDAARPSGTLQPLGVGSAARGPGMPSTGHRGREKQLPLWSNSSDLLQEQADGGGLPPA